MISISCRNLHAFQRAVELASSGRLKMGPLINHALLLEEMSQVLKIPDKRIETIVKAGYKSINNPLRKEIKISSFS